MRKGELLGYTVPMTIIVGDMRDTTMVRPGGMRTKQPVHIPHPDYKEFWDHTYEYIRSHGDIHNPIEKDLIINPYFGYFGEQFHPFIHEAHHFHLGIDIGAPLKTNVFPLCAGILEYAGFHLGNGHYVMLSHPTIKSEDGFILYTFYMHLREGAVGFSKYEKMLREISMRSYPQIPISEKQLLGTVGDMKGVYPHLHLQCEFRHKDGTVISIDPAPLLGLVSQKNKTASLTSEDAFREFFTTHNDDIRAHRVTKYWSV